MLYDCNGKTRGEKMKRKIMWVVMFVLLSILVSAGSFKIQSPVGTDIIIIDTNGNLNASGDIYENNVLLTDTYWNLSDVATPSDGDTTHISTADQIYDYIVSLSYVANAWDALSDMPLNNGLIYIGDGGNNPAAQTMSGDATITNTGVISVVSTQGLDIANITSGDSYWNSSDSLDNDELAEGKIAFSTACAAGEYYRLTGNDLECTTPTDTTYTADAPLNMSNTVFGMINCANGEYYLFNSTANGWTCEPEATGGINNIVEDVTPQLGGDLDVNGFNITDSVGTVNMTITLEGIIIII